MENAKGFTKGQRVRTVFGEVKTVTDAWGCQVFFTDGTWAHPSKVRAV